MSKQTEKPQTDGGLIRCLRQNGSSTDGRAKCSDLLHENLWEKQISAVMRDLNGLFSEDIEPLVGAALLLSFSLSSFFLFSVRRVKMVDMVTDQRANIS